MTNQTPDDIKTAYESALAALKAQKLSGLDSPLPAMMVEEALHLMEDIFGTGLDEESISAAFIAALAAGARRWSHYFTEQHSAAWVHFNKTTEALNGADFVLIFCGPTRYHCIVAQAKRAPKDSSTQKSLRTDKLKAGQVAAADSELQLSLAGRPSNLKSMDGHWQLTKLIHTRARVACKEIKHGAVEYLYSFWYDDGAEPKVKLLEKITAELVATQAVPQPQSVSLEKDVASLRSHVHGRISALQDGAGGTGEHIAELGELLPVLAAESRGYAVVNFSGYELAYNPRASKTSKKAFKS